MFELVMDVVFLVVCGELFEIGIVIGVYFSMLVVLFDGWVYGIVCCFSVEV